MSDQSYISSNASKKYRPSKRVAQDSGEAAPTTLTADFLGVGAAFGNTLLFIGYEVNGLVEIVVYPRYRFSSDDRVHGHIGYVWVPLGTPWETILERVEAIDRQAQENYRLATALRSAELQAHGSRFEAAYDAIADIFRESWHGIALKLNREDQVTKGGATFSGHPPGPVLVQWRGETYTVQVFPTGSISMLMGDKRASLQAAQSGR